MWWLLFFSQKKKLDIESWEDVVQWILCVLNGAFISDKIVMLEAQHATMPMSQKWENTWWKIIPAPQTKVGQPQDMIWHSFEPGMLIWWNTTSIKDPACSEVHLSMTLSSCMAVDNVVVIAVNSTVKNLQIVVAIQLVTRNQLNSRWCFNPLVETSLSLKYCGDVSVLSLPQVGIS